MSKLEQVKKENKELKEENKRLKKIIECYKKQEELCDKYESEISSDFLNENEYKFCYRNTFDYISNRVKKLKIKYAHYGRLSYRYMWLCKRFCEVIQKSNIPKKDKEICKNIFNCFSAISHTYNIKEAIKKYNKLMKSDINNQSLSNEKVYKKDDIISYDPKKNYHLVE